MSNLADFNNESSSGPDESTRLPSLSSSSAASRGRDVTNLSFSSQTGGSPHSNIRMTRSDPLALSDHQNHLNSENSPSEQSSPGASPESAEGDYLSKERRARWIRDKMSNYPNYNNNHSSNKNTNNFTNKNELVGAAVDDSTGGQRRNLYNPVMGARYPQLYTQHRNSGSNAGASPRFPRDSGIQSSNGSGSYWISENDSKEAKFHRPYSLREQRSWRSQAEAAAAPGFGSVDIGKTIAEENNRERLRAGLSLPTEKLTRFQDCVQSEVPINFADQPEEEEEDEHEDQDEEADQVGIITGPSYHFTRRGLPYINRLREHNSRSEDNDLSAGVEVAGGLPHRSRSHSPCSISSESESQGDCENTLDPPRLGLPNGSIGGAGGYIVGGGIAANGRKLSVLFSSYDVWNEENIIQCFKELTPNATTVFEAAWTGKLSLLQEFLKEPDNLKKLQASEFRDGEGRTPLHLASACGHVDCVELLLSKGAEVNVCDGNDNRATPLACAASCGSVQVARVLLNNGADVNSGYEQGKTALHWAIQAGSVECAKILLEAGAKQNPPQVYSETPLHVAAALGDPVCLQLLLDHGADVNLCKGTNRSTALHLSAEEGSAACVRILINAGSSPAAKDIRGHSALHVAATSDADCVIALLKAGADANAVDANGRTPLHCAVARGSRAAECVRLLVENGADIDAQDNYGYTPLHLSAVNESSQCAAILLHHGSDVTLKTNAGTNALSLLVRRIPDVMRYLVDRLDSAVTIHDHDPADPDCEIRLDFRAIVPNCERRGANNGKHNGHVGGGGSNNSSNDFDAGIGAVRRPGVISHDKKHDFFFQKPHRETEFLTCLVAAGNKKILAHPLSEAFLTLKWRRVRKFFWASLLFQIALVALFTIYVVEVYLIRCPYKRDPDGGHANAEPIIQLDNAAGGILQIITPTLELPPEPPDSKNRNLQNESSIFSLQSPPRHNITRRSADPEPEPNPVFQWFSVVPPQKNKSKTQRVHPEDPSYAGPSQLDKGSRVYQAPSSLPAATPSIPSGAQGKNSRARGRARIPDAHSANLFYTEATTEPSSSVEEEATPTRIEKPVIPCQLTTSLQVIWIMLVSFASLLAIKEIFQLLQSPLSYVVSSENWGQWLLISSVTMTAWHTPNFQLQYWQYPAAACGIFVAWALMLLQIGRFPALGLYVQMLGKVAANFGLFILAYACLLIAFALAFCVLFPESPPYSSVALSILKVFTMMVGEVDYEDLFYTPERVQDPLLFPITAHLLYGAFVVIVTIVLMNLLVGLAVHDIQGLQKGAKLNRLSRQTALISRLESFIFSKKLQTVLPNSLGSILQRSALLVPSSYNWSYYFRPNDPRDKRLPKDIKQASLRLAAARHSFSKTKSHRPHSHVSHHHLSHQPVEIQMSSTTPRPLSTLSHHNNTLHHHPDLALRRVEQRLDHLQSQLETVIVALNGRMDAVLGTLMDHPPTRARLRMSLERSRSDNNYQEDEVFQSVDKQTPIKERSSSTSTSGSSPGARKKPTFKESPSILKDVSTENG